MNIKVNNKNKTNSLIINNYLSKSYFDYLEYKTFLSSLFCIVDWYYCICLRIGI